jgi:hypothetical protein
MTAAVPLVQAAEHSAGIHKVANPNLHRVAEKKKKARPTKTAKTTKKKTPTTSQAASAPKS